MDLESALKLTPGRSYVHFPADRGNLAGAGKVINAGPDIVEHLGNKFIWVTVQHAKHRSVWPSNRLG